MENIGYTFIVTHFLIPV